MNDFYKSFITNTMTNVATRSTSALDLPENDPSSLIKNATLTFLVILGILTVVSILISAITMVISNGNAEKVATARRMLLWSIVGLAIALLASVIVNLVMGSIV